VAPSSQFLSVLYQDLWSEYTSVLVHKEVQQLSHGKVLTHVSELCDENLTSLTLKEHKHTDVHADNHWADKLPYVSDILNNLNELNVKCSARMKYPGKYGQNSRILQQRESVVTTH
jgi:hypothetical protein